MIFVITGSEAFPFDRMIREVDMLKKNGVIKDEVFIQLGSCTYVPEHCEYVKWLPFNEMRMKIENADYIITHAGAGTTLLCLEAGKIPLIVVRRSKYGEHLDDHQTELGEIMRDLEFANVAFDAEQIPDIFKRGHEKAVFELPVNQEKDRLIQALNEWIL